MTEQLLMQAIRGVLCHPEAPTRVWRNNVGVLRDDRGPKCPMCHRGKGVPVTYGLSVGSADLIGITHGGQFLAVEVKTPDGRLSTEQKAWLKTVERFGGMAEVARSVEDAHNIIRRINEKTRT